MMKSRVHTSIRGALVSIAAIMLVVTVGAIPAAAATTVTSFNPTSGPPGTLVSVTGTGFTAGGVAAVTAVTFNGTGTTFNVTDDQHLTATVPIGASTGKIAVAASGSTGTSAADFVVPTSPTISSFSPTNGNPGTAVTINGTHLTGVNGVKFNGVTATFIFLSDAQVATTVPTGATTGKITLTTPSGTATSASDFIVGSGAAPTINSFSPTSGGVGTSVTISGSRFTGVNAVRFNGVVAVFSFVSDGIVIATVPSGATKGKITLTTPSGTATSSSSFTVTTSTAPTIGSFSPTSGGVGTSVTINGSRFTGVNSVRFNGVTAVFSFVSDGRVTATVPSGATTGRITLTTPSGTATSSSNFTVSGTSSSITSFSPTSGNVGTSVTINGSRFTGVNAVRFNGRTAAFSFISDTRVIATVPTGATTGRITVTTSSGTATSSSNFTVTGGGGTHERNVTLDVSGRYATGSVSVSDGYKACASNAPVVIKRLRHGEWHWVTTTSTGSDGRYRALIGTRNGEFRARAIRITLVNGDICGGDRSNIVHG